MDRYGIGRSLEPRGALPQQADVLDASLPARPGEIEVAVDYLNVDSASWHQIAQTAGGDPERIRALIRDTVARRGKMHNPATGSGGILVGTVRALGAGRTEPAPGTRIASLVSLTLTPLALRSVGPVDPASEKVPVEGHAILFASSAWARLPAGLGDRVALGVLDVCGAPAWTARLARPGMRVAILGAGGKSGMLAAAQAVRAVGPSGRVLGICWPAETAAAAKDAGAEPLAVDATDAIAVGDAVADSLGGEPADLVLVCTNVPGCEGAALLACRDGGRIVFFSMATSFTTAALVAEGMGKDCEMTIGSGFVPGHAELALDLVTSEPALLERFSA